MKSYILLLGFSLCVSATYAQWFKDHVKIRQSMETAETREEPAQLQLTLPKNDSNTIQLDLGVSVTLNSPSANFLSKVIGEYHRNTQIDAPQNNIQVGYAYNWDAIRSKKQRSDVFVAGTLKYVYDGIQIKNSLFTDLLLTIYNDNTDHLHWNAPNRFQGSHLSFLLSPYVGIQAQDLFRAEKEESRGFILRPLFDLATILDYNRNKPEDVADPNKMFELSLKYVGRSDVVNKTSNKENYTHLFKAAISYFFPYKDRKSAKISLGLSYNNGSDPAKGLLDQQYWLMSLNLSK